MRFTEEDDANIRRYYPTKGMKWDGWATLVPNHNVQSIASRANRLGLVSINARELWTEAEDLVLLKHALEIRRETGRSAGAIAGRLATLAARNRKKE